MIRCLGNRKFRFVVWRIGRVLTKFYLHLRFGQQGHEGELERNVPKRSPKSSTNWIFFWKLVHLCINLLNLLFWRFCVPFYHGINHQYTNLVEICICLVHFFLIVLAKQNRSLAAFLSHLPFQLLRDVGTQPLGHIFANIWACDCKGVSFDSKLFWHIFLLMSLFWKPPQDLYIIQNILYLEPKWPLFWMDEAFFGWVQAPK